jgi:hypothetical protein
MSLLGFDAIGRWALGQLPQSGGFALSASAGGFAMAGTVAAFAVSETAGTGAFSLVGTSSTFKFSEPAAGGSFVMSGAAEAFMVTEAASVGGIVLVLGMATIDLIGSATAPAGGFAFTGMPAQLVIRQAALPSAYALTGFTAGYTRDFINWVTRTFAPARWATDTTPSPGWTAANSQESAWNNAAAPAPGWIAAATASNAWTVDPAESIPPPVSG